MSGPSGGPDRTGGAPSPWISKRLLLFQVIPAVPVREKRPLIAWGDLSNGARQDPGERKRIIEGALDGKHDIALVCGHYVEGRGYFCAIDIDLPYQEALRHLRGVADCVTYMESTPRGGLHLYYFAERPVPTKKLAGVPIELKGQGSLIVVHPSKGYQPLNDNMPRTIEDAFELWREICAALGYDVDDYLREEARETEVDDRRLDEWLRAIVAELERRGLKPRRGPNYYTSLCPFHPERHPSFAVNHRKFYAIDYHDGRVFKLLDLAKALGLELITEFDAASDKPQKTRDRWLVGGEIVGEALVEIVAGETVDGEVKPALLVYYPARNRIEVVAQFEHDGVVYRPYPDLPFALPKAPDTIGPDPTLWEETREFIKSHFDHLDERVYDVLAAAVAWSYFYRDVKGSTPYLLFLGPWRSGKTRALETLEALCYRAVRVVDPSEASLFRVVELFRPTLLVDEMQVIDGNVRAVMASAYRYGAKVMRVVDPEDKGLSGIKFFSTFAFIIYASREEPPGDILSRSIVVHCERNTRPLLKRLDEAKAAELRTRWLAQRLRYFGKIEVRFDEFASDDGRLQEILSPLLVMARTFGGQDAAERVESFGRDWESELQGIEATSPEAEVVEGLLRVLENHPGDVPEVIEAREVAEALGGDWTPEKVGRRLSSFGLKRVKLPNGRRGYRVDLNLIVRLAQRYRLKLPPLHFAITADTAVLPNRLSGA